MILREKIKSSNTAVLNANYSQNAYTVTFNSNGGTAVQSQTIPHGGKVSKPANPTKADYWDFVDWYSDQELAKVYDFSTPVTSNLTLYAKWERSGVTVTYDANGGTIDGSPTKSVDAKYGDTIVIISSVPIKDGYIFSKWSDKTGKTYSPGESFTITESVLDLE